MMLVQLALLVGFMWLQYSWGQLLGGYQGKVVRPAKLLPRQFAFWCLAVPPVLAVLLILTAGKVLLLSREVCPCYL